jgi:hypothetical protein
LSRASTYTPKLYEKGRVEGGEGAPPSGNEVSNHRRGFGFPCPRAINNPVDLLLGKKSTLKEVGKNSVEKTQLLIE